jgi:hypothetical protein
LRWLERQPEAANLGRVGLLDLQQALGVNTNKLLYEVRSALAPSCK